MQGQFNWGQRKVKIRISLRPSRLERVNTSGRCINVKKSIPSYLSEMKQNFLKAFELFRKDPIGLIRILRALLKGTFYIAFYGIAKRKVRIEFPFFAYAPLNIYGDGKVHIHKNCSSLWNVFKGATIVTLSSEAEVVIGEGCDLGGATIRCADKIEIGARTLTANSLIQDTLFVNQSKCRSKAPSHLMNGERGICIGRRSWLCAQSVVLQGTAVGNQSVIGSGSLCLDAHVPEHHLTVGSPVSRSIKIDSLLHLFGR